MSKHTEGPWEYLSSGNGSCGAITSKTGWVCDFVDNPSPEDARLIAAAPELLEALENIMGWIPAEPVKCNGNKCRELYCVSCFGEDTAEETLEGLKVKVDIAKQVIAKAKGGGEHER